MTMPTETEGLVEEHHPPSSSDDRQKQASDKNNNNNNMVQSSISEPAWLTSGRNSSLESWGEPLTVPEWQTNDDDSFRSKNGWLGRDLIHDVRSPVRITEYYVSYGEGRGLPHAMFPEGRERRGGAGTRLTGIALFTNRAESHRGFCHGGSMCSVLDDVVGWCGFVVTGRCRPWSGFTVQINAKLQKPVPVGSTLLVRATVTRVERRKVSIEARLVQPNEGGEEAVHATGEGLVVLNKGVLPESATRGSLHSWPSSIEIT